MVSPPPSVYYSTKREQSQANFDFYYTICKLHNIFVCILCIISIDIVCILCYNIITVKDKTQTTEYGGRCQKGEKHGRHEQFWTGNVSENDSWNPERMREHWRSKGKNKSPVRAVNFKQDFSTTRRSGGTCRSHSTWVRELKYVRKGCGHPYPASHSTWVRELKWFLYFRACYCTGRTPRECVSWNT